MSELVVWSAGRGEWVSRPADEITWLDRTLLSGGHDRSLHRPPRCPGLRYVHHRWELFSRDPTHPVYVAPFVAGTAPDHLAVQAEATHVLPAAKAALEAQPARLDAGSWLVSVGSRVLPICIDVVPDGRDSPTVPVGDGLPVTYDMSWGSEAPPQRTPPAPDAVSRVASYFQRNPTACLAMAYYYQDFIVGGLAPQPVPLAKVAVALDLSSDAAASEYKKELQRRIWNEQGHQRELGEFLLVHGLISQADLSQALQLAATNEAAGRTQLARERLRYGGKKSRRGHQPVE
jgi:hypothetical protein